MTMLPATPKPVEYPFVLYKSTATTIGGLDTRIFSNEVACIVDSIWAGNQADSDLLLNIYLMKNTEVASEKIPLITKWPFQPFEGKELIERSVLYLEPGDLLFAFTDFSETHLTITVSFRALMNQSIDNTHPSNP